MPGGNSDVNASVRINSHSIWIVLHSFPHIFRPLTADVVGNHNPWQSDEEERTKDKIVHVAVPSHNKNGNHSKEAMKKLTFPPFAGQLLHFYEQEHAANT
jgi:hypothetical protein